MQNPVTTRPALVHVREKQSRPFEGSFPRFKCTIEILSDASAYSAVRRTNMMYNDQFLKEKSSFLKISRAFKWSYPEDRARRRTWKNCFNGRTIKKSSGTGATVG